MTDLAVTLDYWVARYEAAKFRHQEAERRGHSRKRRKEALQMGFAHSRIIRSIDAMRDRG